MRHIYQEAKPGHPTFILLHGTGGDEHNLLPLAEILDSEAGILSIRGQVSENGMLRFFKRNAEGVYDVADLNQRGKELYAFIEKAANDYDFSLDEAIYIGFSNGSNIAINMLLLEETLITKGALFAPMYPVDLSDNYKNLEGTDIYLSMGRRDPIVSVQDSNYVIELFQKRGANVTPFWVNTHELNQETLIQAKRWLDKLS